MLLCTFCLICGHLICWVYSIISFLRQMYFLLHEKKILKTNGSFFKTRYKSKNQIIRINQIKKKLSSTSPHTKKLRYMMEVTHRQIEWIAEGLHSYIIWIKLYNGKIFGSPHSPKGYLFTLYKINILHLLIFDLLKTNDVKQFSHFSDCVRVNNLNNKIFWQLFKPIETAKKSIVHCKELWDPKNIFTKLFSLKNDEWNLVGR